MSAGKEPRASQIKHAEKLDQAALSRSIRAALAMVNEHQAALAGGDLLDRQVVDLAWRCEAALLYQLSPQRGEVWRTYALNHLAGAADYLRRYLLEPHVFRNVATIADAAWLLGKAEGLEGNQAVVNAKRSRGRSLVAPAHARIVAALQVDPHASSQALESRVHASARYINATKAKIKKGTQ